MNIHPLFVHFPIGLLVVYSFLEIGAYVWPTLRRQSWFFSVKAFLLFSGVFTALLALGTGGLAEELIEDEHPRAFIIEMHSFFAGAATFVYLILTLVHFNRIAFQNSWFDEFVGENPFLIRIRNWRKFFTHSVMDTWGAPFLALVGLGLLTIAGGLGAAIVYGPDIDPFVSFIYHLFWAN